MALWGVAVSVLVVSLGIVWRSGTAFLVVLGVWLLVVLPLMVRTARWLRSREDG